VHTNRLNWIIFSFVNNKTFNQTNNAPKRKYWRHTQHTLITLKHPYIFHIIIFITEVQMQHIVQPITPERLLPRCIILLPNNITSIKATLLLHTKDTPSHRQRFYTYSLNEIYFRKIHNFPKNINVFLTTQFYVILLLVILILIILYIWTICNLIHNIL